MQNNPPALNEGCIDRIRDFQNQLIGWGISWNIALIGASFLKTESRLSPFIPFIALTPALLLNYFLGKIYINESNKNKQNTGNADKAPGITLNNLKKIWWTIQITIAILILLNVFFLVPNCCHCLNG